jgi:hypothetical protein
MLLPGVQLWPVATPPSELSVAVDVELDALPEVDPLLELDATVEELVSPPLPLLLLHAQTTPTTTEVTLARQPSLAAFDSLITFSDARFEQRLTVQPRRISSDGKRLSTVFQRRAEERRRAHGRIAALPKRAAHQGEVAHEEPTSLGGGRA